MIYNPAVRLLKRRLVKFTVVGTVCLMVQFVILKLLEHVNINRSVADAAGFILSSQLNYILSSNLTWRDARRLKGKAQFYRWAGFLGAAIAASGVNALAFTVIAPLAGDLIGVLCAGAVSTSLTFVVNNFVVFHHRFERVIASD